MENGIFVFFGELFSGILNMSVTAGIVILAVLLLRLLLGKAPKIFSYLLWSVVLFRLLCPVSFSSPFSLLNAVDATTSDKGTIEYAAPLLAQPGSPATAAPAGNEDGVAKKTSDEEGAPPPSIFSETQRTPSETKQTPSEIKQTPSETEQAPAKAKQTFSLAVAAAIVWVFGVGVLAAYSLVSLILLRRKTACFARLRENIYLADNIASPFVFGLIRPRIYLPSFLGTEEREYIILHEKHHIRRGDHVVKLLAFAALCLHWFNPLVWLAFALAGKDMEMSCDEAVMRKMDRDIRAEYSASLLHLATGRRIFAGYPLAFGEGDPKSRIKNVMDYKKPAFWVVVIATAACVAAGVCLFTNPKRAQREEQEKTVPQAGAVTDAEGSGMSDDRTATATDAEENGTPESQEQETGEQGHAPEPSAAELPKVDKTPVAQHVPDELEKLRTRHIYSDILTNITASYGLLDPTMGVEFVLNPVGQPMEENRFAVWDVNGDGREELVIEYTTAAVADMKEFVYGYDYEKNEITLEMMEFPAVTYYDNGIAIVQASHNHSYSDDVWPCTLYQYRPEKGIYEAVANYCAWNKALYPEIERNGRLGNPFPDELDRDGDGVLYSICAGEVNAENYQYDKAEFEAWLADCLDGAQEIMPDYAPLVYKEFKDFTPKYLEALYQAQTDTDHGTDIGWKYHELNDLDEIRRYVTEHYGIELKQDPDDEEMQNGYQDGEKVFGFYVPDGGCLQYYGRQVGDVTFFGIYPGMDAQEAKRILVAHGFYDDPIMAGRERDDTDRRFWMITGDGFTNVSIFFEADDAGRVSMVSQRAYDAYTG